MGRLPGGGGIYPGNLPGGGDLYIAKLPPPLPTGGDDIYMGKMHRIWGEYPCQTWGQETA